jgi:hypothetical protein
MGAAVTFETCSHEAAHVSAAWLLGRTVESVRVDRPDVNVDGEASVPCEPNVEFKDLVITLIAYIAVPDSLPQDAQWPPRWPVDLLDTYGDWHRCAAIVRRLRLTEELYNKAVEDAQHLIETREFRHLHRLVAAALRCVPVLDHDQLTYLIGEPA